MSEKQENEQVCCERKVVVKVMAGDGKSCCGSESGERVVKVECCPAGAEK